MVRCNILIALQQRIGVLRGGGCDLPCAASLAAGAAELEMSARVDSSVGDTYSVAPRGSCSTSPNTSAISFLMSSAGTEFANPGTPPGPTPSRNSRSARCNRGSPDRPTRRGEAPHASVPRNSRLQKRADVGLGADQIDRRQRADVESASAVGAVGADSTGGASAAGGDSSGACCPQARACGATSAQGISPDRSFAFHRRSAPRQRFRIGAIALAFDERLLDMVLGDKGRNACWIAFGIGTVLDDIGAGFGQASPSAGSAVTAAKS